MRKTARRIGKTAVAYGGNRRPNIRNTNSGASDNIPTTTAITAINTPPTIRAMLAVAFSSSSPIMIMYTAPYAVIAASSAPVIRAIGEGNRGGGNACCVVRVV